MADPERRRRRRPAASCTLCRQRKIRCNRETPCSNCVRARNESCIYESFPAPLPPPARQHQQHVYPPGRDTASSTSRASTAPSLSSSQSLVAGSTTASTPVTQSSSIREVDSLRSTIRQLEEHLSKATTQTSTTPDATRTSNSNIETFTTSIGGTVYVNHDNWFGPPLDQLMCRSVMHKNRLLGQSHWVNGVTMFLDILKTIEPHVRADTSSVSSTLQRCKSLARVIKAQQAPAWPPPPNTNLPDKILADQLVECYVRTSEAIYRILHIPSFKRDYDALWEEQDGPATPRDKAFLVQVKLVLAIGAAIYDEQFSLRTSAIRWVYEAHSWISEPEFKPRLSLQGIQTSLLLLLAREATNVGETLIWVSVGTLLRSAVYMGLHRDPSRLPKKTPLAAEMRRRLWNTTLEMALHASLSAGTPPFLSLGDFDTEPPGNFDDDQLLAEDEDPTPRPDDEYTQTSVARALRKTFPFRLAVTKFLNDLGSRGTYEETLRLDAELRASYKILSRTLQACRRRNESGSASNLGASSGAPSQFALRAVDFIMSRYLAAVHVPFFRPALHETAFAFSRKVVLETSLKMWCAAYPTSSLSLSGTNHAAASTASSTRSTTAAASATDHDDLARMIKCGSGFFRIATYQAALLIATELRAQLQDEDYSLSPSPLRPGLHAVLEEAKLWAVRCIEAGETNVKGHLFLVLIAAQIEALMVRRGGPGLASNKDDGDDADSRFTADMLLKAAREAVEQCLPILEDKARQLQQQPSSMSSSASSSGAGHRQSVDQLDQMMMALPEDEDWDFMMSDAHFNFEPTTTSWDVSLW